MIEVTHYTGRHEGGTKEYHLSLLFSTATRGALLIKRWGKIGTDGQVKVELAKGTGQEELNKLLRDRSRNGYDMRLVSSNSGRMPDVPTALASVLPSKLRSAVTAAQAKTLDPNLDYDPMRDARNEKFGESVQAQLSAVEQKRKARDDEEFLAASQLPNAGLF